MSGVSRLMNGQEWEKKEGEEGRLDQEHQLGGTTDPQPYRLRVSQGLGLAVGRRGGQAAIPPFPPSPSGAPTRSWHRPSRSRLLS